jgi:DNA polymerase-3 subunit gamma/tau
MAETDHPAPPPQPSFANPKSFEEVVALAEEKRDLKLKHALSEQVRLVRFRPGHLELNPLPNAPKELGQDLMRKLKTWTGRVWIVALSGEEGAAPLGVQRREREAREIERIRDHPDVKQVLQHFPGARIAAVRATASEEPPAEVDEVAETEFKEDGTDP